MGFFALCLFGCLLLFPLVRSNGGKDVFWQSRDNALLIKGGANYSYDQINDDLTKFLCVSRQPASRFNFSDRTCLLTTV